jgi:hypothetical protein
MNPHTHPVLTAVAAIDAALKDVADVDPTFMRTAEKQAALLRLSELSSRVDELRLRVLASAGDVAEQTGARDAAAWLSHEARLDRPATRREARLAEAVDRRWTAVGAAVREGTVNLDQVAVIVRALDDLPDEVDRDVRRKAEARLVELAGEFGPRQLRILGRRVLDVIAPEVAEEHERKALERERANALRRTFLTTRRNGDGTTDLRIRISDLAADRLLTYLSAFTSPRRTPKPGEPVHDLRPYDKRLGHAFVAFLESVDPRRMPLHGGDATTVIVTIDHQQLVTGLGTALVGDTPITAGEARRLTCTAGVVPAVLGGASEILDLGRLRRLYSPAQRKAMAIRDKRCRAEGCDIPAAWCEAHHAGAPWAAGGRTDLADGVLLCSWHHHRAHDRRYDARRLASGDVRFRRRT